ncbi:methyltransferase [Marinobacter alexandrii]|jgi:hypothetical protein|uniref:methyltransferase n=1 Tax=Marinobacter alexandrii TaxID=2570351 RepID=UPI002ABDBBD9|nr:methyltransferase [Marinobacter alexandrii]
MTLPPAASLHDPAESFYSHWLALNDWLHEHRGLWQPAPFMEPNPEWTRRYPDLARLIAEVSDEQCQSLEDEPAKLAVMAGEHVPSLARYERLIALADLKPADVEVSQATLPEVRAVDMPGRKRSQSGAFAAAIRPLEQSVLDWCCGKGHLARTLAAVCPEPVHGLEWNAELVRDGNRLAEQFGDAVSLQCQDVMAQDLALPPETHGVALHACGDLHRRLMRQGSEVGLSRLSFSPCCYHLTHAGIYRPMSRRAASQDRPLALSRNDLRLAVQETVTAPARVREQTRRVSQWRLGFDCLQRKLRGRDEYLPVPSHPSKLIHEGFAGFCRWAANKKALALPPDIDFDAWETQGARRWQHMRRHELVRHLFRRPLELWMVLDYALYLEEQGYRVRLGEFCDRSLTPRNLLLDAVRKKAEAAK